MSLLRTGMSDGAAVNLLRAQVERRQDADPDRKRRRLREIPAMVSSARAKLGEPEPRPQPAEAISPQPTPGVFDPWARYIVPAFPFDILPTEVEKFIGAQATVIGGDPSALALPPPGCAISPAPPGRANVI
jgi:hypothetical protein